MTKKLFWTDPYLTSLDTRISSVSANEITTAETIFYAFSGGQESDAGTIGEYPVLGARKDGLDIIYTVPADHDLVPGAVVRVEIDGVRRSRLLRLHFAAELVLVQFYALFKGIEKTGAHISADKARLDFLWPESIAPGLPEIAEKVNALIAADLKITSAFEDEKTERRYWEIDGLSRVPCGGTHPRRTGEVGPVHLQRNNRGRGQERVEIFLDPR